MKSLSKAAIALIAIGVAFAFLVVTIIGVFVAVNGNQKTATGKENALSAQYLDNQNELSAFISKVHELLGVAQTNTAALDKVLTDAVKGRYTGDTTAKPGGGQLFSAITEAYPDLASNTVLYSKVADAISSGREAYKNKQSKLLDMLQSYDTWRKSGYVHRQLVALAGVPTDSLKARVGDQVLTGESAVDKMYQIVLAGDAEKAYQTGKMDPIDTNLTDNK